MTQAASVGGDQTISPTSQYVTARQAVIDYVRSTGSDTFTRADVFDALGDRFADHTLSRVIYDVSDQGQEWGSRRLHSPERMAMLSALPRRIPHSVALSRTAGRDTEADFLAAIKRLTQDGRKRARYKDMLKAAKMEPQIMSPLMRRFMTKAGGGWIATPETTALLRQIPGTASPAPAAEAKPARYRPPAGLDAEEEVKQPRTMEEAQALPPKAGRPRPPAPGKRMGTEEIDRIFFNALKQIGRPKVRYNEVQQVSGLSNYQVAKKLKQYALKANGDTRKKSYWIIQLTGDHRAAQLGIELPWTDSPKFASPPPATQKREPEAWPDRMPTKSERKAGKPAPQPRAPRITEHTRKVEYTVKLDGQSMGPLLWLAGVSGGASVLAIVAAALTLGGF